MLELAYHAEAAAAGDVIGGIFHWANDELHKIKTLFPIK